MSDERIKLILDMGASGANVEEVKKKLEQLEPALEKTGNKMAGVGQSALQSGRFLQDFAQGGVGGVLNNIEGLAMALGGGPGLAGVLTAVGLAAFFAMPKLKEFFGAMETPEQTEKRTKALEREKEMVEAVTKARKAQADELKKLRELQPEGETGRQKERAETLQAKFGERGEREALVGEVAQGMATPEQRAAREKTREQLKADAAFFQRGLAQEKDPILRADLQRQAQAAQKRLGSLTQTEQRERGQAEQMVAGAVIGGREEDVQGVLGRLPEDSRFRRAFASQTSAEMIRNKRLAEQAKVNQEQDKEDRGQAKQEERDMDKEMSEDRKRIHDEQRRIEGADRRNRQEFQQQERGRKQAGGRQMEQMAGQAVMSLPQILPQAFGPEAGGQAAMIAQMASPAEIQAMHKETIQNMQSGQDPAMAAVNALRDVYQQSQQMARQQQFFGNQMSKMRTDTMSGLGR